MSRQSHLPPRCPFQKKTTTRPTNGAASPAMCQETELYPRHHKSRSQSSILEEHPTWLDDLLNDVDSNSGGAFHRRSASDSLTLLDGIASLPSLSKVSDEENSSFSEACSGLESACMYGPNSPRRKGKVPFPENAIASALSETASQNIMRYLDGGLFISGASRFDSVQDTCVGEVNAETKPLKRCTGQRSRVRKVQYIAELERTVDVFQTLESDLALRVASLLQQHAALSLENSKLKQQMASVQQQKLIMDGQYQSLQKEVERLKISLAYVPNRKVSTGFRSTAATDTINSEATWLMLNMGKLDLN